MANKIPAVPYRPLAQKDIQDPTLSQLNENLRMLTEQVNYLSGAYGKVVLPPKSGLDAGMNQINNVANPTNANDAVNLAHAGNTYATIESLNASTGYLGVQASSRPEAFIQGFYTDGNAGPVVNPTPVSPIDGYQYQRSETSYLLLHYSTQSPQAPFTPGQLVFPTLAVNAGSGNLLSTPFVLRIGLSFQANPGVITVQNKYTVSGAITEGTVFVVALGFRGQNVG